RSRSRAARTHRPPGPAHGGARALARAAAGRSRRRRPRRGRAGHARRRRLRLQLPAHALRAVPGGGAAMTPERWRRGGEPAQAPGERPPSRPAASGGDDDLGHEAESLLAAHHDAGTFAGPPASLEEGTLGDPPPTRTLEPGARLGPYEVLDLIAAGGMGEVY